MESDAAPGAELEEVSQWDERTESEHKSDSLPVPAPLFKHAPDGEQGQAAKLLPLQRALDETQLYLEHIRLKDDDDQARSQLLSMFHVLDHLQRLHERCDKEESRVLTARATSELADECTRMCDSISQNLHDVENQQLDAAIQCTEDLQQRIQNERPPYRASIMEQIATGELDVPEGTRRLEAIRWLDRVSHHLARIIQHLDIAQTKHPEKTG